MPRTKNNGEISSTHSIRTTTGNTSLYVKKTATANKKEPPVNIKVPTARQKAKEFDEGRRQDAESNDSKFLRRIESRPDNSRTGWMRS